LIKQQNTTLQRGKDNRLNLLKSRADHLLAELCNTITRQPIELWSCSNHLRIREVFYFRLKKFFRFGLGFVVSDITVGACFNAFVAEVTGPGDQPIEPFFGSSCFWILGCHPSLQRLWLTC